MKQVVHIVRKEDLEKKLILGLKFELDYELASLFDAMQKENQKEIDKSKLRLGEIHSELKALHALH
ncbi:hypothetical protein [Paenisporosarcina antarctica]|uniref:Uncharacterized protein n=1 Tax=Paenisporosarcina antarctica TaxID=417367 RepID=A0A4P6ZZ32_9BACL|nr:hypothetical protein [Paenisporosarcina antarctica]QBP41593.1 hypothetical protein E2636_10755 [Paenisporosarcina antarctica]